MHASHLAQLHSCTEMWGSRRSDLRCAAGSMLLCTGPSIGVGPIVSTLPTCASSICSPTPLFAARSTPNNGLHTPGHGRRPAPNAALQFALPA